MNLSQPRFDYGYQSFPSLIYFTENELLTTFHINKDKNIYFSTPREKKALYGIAHFFS